MSELQTVSNQLNNEEWQQDLLSSIEVGIVVVDRAFNVHVWNQFMQNHSEVPLHDIEQKNLFTFFPSIEIDWFARKCEPVFDMGTPSFIVWEQRPFVFKFGTSRPITSGSDFMYQNVTIFPLASDTGKTDKICILVYDVTDQALQKKSIENLNQQLQEVSRTDGLTGLSNRRYWQERFEREYKMAVRKNSDICVMILDIDHFKKVNDTHGHLVGDLVIQRLAKLIQLATRETDIIGRFGGEEFVVILPDTQENTANVVGERLRKLVSLDKVEHDELQIKFTISIGISKYKEKYSKSNEWLDDADRALYYAKENGRNQVVLAGDLAEQ